MDDDGAEDDGEVEEDEEEGSPARCAAPEVMAAAPEAGGHPAHPFGRMARSGGGGGG